MLLWGTCGFIAGFQVMWSVELQLQWMLFACLPAVIAECRRQHGAGVTRAPVLWLALAFLLWNLGMGILRNPETLALRYTQEFLAGSVALPVFWLMIWLTCRRQEWHRILLHTVFWSSLLAAVAGLGWWLFVQNPEVPGARLRNPLVYGGLHPVPTAIQLGFGVIAGALLYNRASSRNVRAAVLCSTGLMTLALMFTLSRSGLLVVLFGFAAALAVLGWRRALPPALTAGAAAAVFYFLAPLFTTLDLHVASSGEDAPPAVNLSLLTDTPAREYFARADSGRLHFYRSGIAMLDSWDRHLFGAGLWGPEEKLKTLYNQSIDHFHSLFVATYVHGGVTGVALLLAILGIGLVKAWQLARAGQPHWLILLCCGAGGLLFDSQSACSLVTHSRFENLILWFPLIGAAAAANTRQSTAQP